MRESEILHEFEKLLKPDRLYIAFMKKEGYFKYMPNHYRKTCYKIFYPKKRPESCSYGKQFRYSCNKYTF